MSWKHTKKILAQNVQGETRKLKNSRKARRRRHLAIPALLLAILTMGIVMVAIHYYTAETYLVLQGDEQITVGKHGLFEDPGVIAKRGARDVSDKVEIDSNLDLSTPGEYEIITSPEVTGLIAHEAFGHGVEMDMFVKNRVNWVCIVFKY